jgi:hypothetical protein
MSLVYGNVDRRFELMFIPSEYPFDYDTRLFTISTFNGSICIKWNGIQVETTYPIDITVEGLIPAMGFYAWQPWGEVPEEYLSMRIVDITDERICITGPYGHRWSKKEWVNIPLQKIEAMRISHIVEQNFEDFMGEEFATWFIERIQESAWWTGEEDQIDNIIEWYSEDYWLRQETYEYLISQLLLVRKPETCQLIVQ